MYELMKSVIHGQNRQIAVQTSAISDFFPPS